MNSTQLIAATAAVTVALGATAAYGDAGGVEVTPQAVIDPRHSSFEPAWTAGTGWFPAVWRLAFKPC